MDLQQPESFQPVRIRKYDRGDMLVFWLPKSIVEIYVKGSPCLMLRMKKFNKKIITLIQISEIYTYTKKPTLQKLFFLFVITRIFHKCFKIFTSGSQFKSAQNPLHFPKKPLALFNSIYDFKIFLHNAHWYFSSSDNPPHFENSEIFNKYKKLHQEWCLITFSNW